MYVYLRAATTPGASVMFYWYHVDDAHDTCGPIDEDLDPGCEDYWVPGTACASAVPFAAPCVDLAVPRAAHCRVIRLNASNPVCVWQGKQTALLLRNVKWCSLRGSEW